MSTQVRWYGTKVMGVIEREMENRLDQAAEFLKVKTQKALLRLKYPPTRSKPGQIPHWETSKLAKSVFWQRKAKLSRIIGVPAIRVPAKGYVSYGLFLQLGTRKMEARPYLDVVLRANEKKIESILTRKPIK